MGTYADDLAGFSLALGCMSWIIPFRSCTTDIDCSVIVVNKPPGVAYRLRDEEVARCSTVLGHSDRLRNTLPAPLRKWIHKVDLWFSLPPR